MFTVWIDLVHSRTPVLADFNTFQLLRLSTKIRSVPRLLKTYLKQKIFQVPLKGGRDYITPQKAIYMWYFSCQLGDGLCHRSHPLRLNLKNPLTNTSLKRREVFG